MILVCFSGDQGLKRAPWPWPYCALEGSATKLRAVKDKETRMLPEVIDDFVKRNRTKYVHLLDQDTTRGVLEANAVDPRKETVHLCGGPHIRKDCR